MKKYIVFDIITQQYFYGNYTNMRWTKDVTQAKIFDYKFEAKDFIASELKKSSSWFEIKTLYAKWVTN